jgi:hypothetical protein
MLPDVRWVGFLPSPFDCDKLFFSSPFSPVQAEAEEKSEAKPKRGGRRAAEVETPAAEPAKRGRRGAAVVEDQVSMFITLSPPLTKRSNRLARVSCKLDEPDLMFPGNARPY